MLEAKLGVEYFLSRENGLCSDCQNAKAVSNLAECKIAFQYDSIQVEDTKDFPSGCYQLDKKVILWNESPIGYPRNTTELACKSTVHTTCEDVIGNCTNSYRYVSVFIIVISNEL